MGDTTPQPAQAFGGFSIGQQPMRNLAQPFGVIGNAVKHLLGEPTDEERLAEERRREWQLKEKQEEERAMLKAKKEEQEQEKQALAWIQKQRQEQQAALDKLNEEAEEKAAEEK